MHDETHLSSSPDQTAFRYRKDERTIAAKAAKRPFPRREKEFADRNEPSGWRQSVPLHASTKTGIRRLFTKI
ncbi:hypothetical protein HMPREF9012_1986 [Bacteroidetes bacterium oral taxon 272 str. F0290]|nr:hypothetical protein HMPREF9012_1986 [Bacteroidetes bacterium oral taxon 272 str. F0290]